MQSIARDSEDSTDDEFFDAHGKMHFAQETSQTALMPMAVFYILTETLCAELKMISVKPDTSENRLQKVFCVSDRRLF